MKRNETIAAALNGSGINWITGVISNEIRKKLKIDTLKKITKGELEKFD